MNATNPGGKHLSLCMLVVVACLAVRLLYARRPWDSPVETEVTGSSANYMLCIHNGGLGRLGNYMFKYASTLGIAHSQNYTPAVVVTNTPLLDSFNITSKRLNQTQWTSWHTFKERCASCYDKRVRLLNGQQNQHLVGYFQSWKYFADPDVQRIIRREFQFKDSISQEAKAFIAEATEWYWARLRNISRSEAGNLTTNDRMPLKLIGIHVRRGDMASYRSRERGYGVAPASYIKKAMSYLQQKHAANKLIFIVCTDTRNWVKKELLDPSLPIYLSEGRRSVVDMAILSLCSDVIMTVGSFGWWSAWLAGGRTIYWKDYPKPGSTIARGFNAKDYYPPGWVPMSG